MEGVEQGPCRGRGWHAVVKGRWRDSARLVGQTLHNPPCLLGSHNHPGIALSGNFWLEMHALCALRPVTPKTDTTFQTVSRAPENSWKQSLNRPWGTKKGSSLRSQLWLVPDGSLFGNFFRRYMLNACTNQNDTKLGISRGQAS